MKVRKRRWMLARKKGKEGDQERQEGVKERRQKRGKGGTKTGSK